MLTCPNCKLEIDDDSWFCDQCGQELKFCPQCHRTSRGKFCAYDGKELLKASDLFGATSTNTSKPIIHEQQPVPLSTSTPIPELHLVNLTLKLDLIIQPGDIIGRTTGRFADLLSSYTKVSRQHCKFEYDTKAGWKIIDLGSTNGTKVNGSKIEPHKPYPLINKSFIIIGNIEFYVDIKDKNNQELTERIL